MIILAAGKGSRMMPFTRNMPKALLDLGWGKSLLEHQLEGIRKSGVIDQVVLVTGYLSEQIEEKVKTWSDNGFKISTIYNPFYDMADNLVSLWMARSEMDEDFMITNGDNLFSEDVFRDLRNNHNQGIFLTICKKERYGHDDMKVILAGNKAVKVSKLIDGEQGQAESPGLVFVSGERYREFFKQSLDELTRNKENFKTYWLEVFNLMSRKGAPVDVFKIDRAKWQEIDIHPDLEDLRRRFKSV